ncbi:MAG: hypothetical protein QGF53_07685 [Alphaproteobacteria bacterium]|jgi:hypothetical protein|nr:hypothetical protein [Alphaproteobacteria bacterium]
MAQAKKSPGVLLFGVLSANLLLAGVVYVLSGGASLAETWASFDRNSLVGLQALVEQRLDPNPEDPQLFFDVVLPVLESPTWLVALVVLMVMDALPLALLLSLARRGARQRGNSVERSE